ncbi:NAD(P)-dependent oxidoreductase [Neomegalonema sp.]|uniref:NAD(P)-dependent oxidoreductase n=1 Tax=Neomegalonema sp. TaxID=2039713 RepID=UPI002613AE5F|nr:NAD(P)-dependent oxidoreductase [Neomegalonema sp.]MDD2868605.1 NAD(P)-dependent oxidoreductase [Neomegalonema sp.]
MNEMKAFPLFVKVEGERALILGGGEEAARKARLLLKSCVKIEVFAADLNEELAALVASGRATRLARESDLQGARVAFVATGDEAEDARLAALARAGGALVNVVDRPELCDFYTPALVDRAPLVAAIGTEGAAPVLARRIKTRLESLLEPDLGALAALAADLREPLAESLPPEARRGFWLWVFAGEPRRLAAQGRLAEAEALMRRAMAEGRLPETEPGALAVIGAGPGAPDLLSLRAAQRLQEADLILHDPGLDPGFLEIARRDSERLAFAGDASALMRAAAEAGRRVARLRAGEAREAPEAALLRAAGFEVEHLPGLPPLA